MLAQPDHLAVVEVAPRGGLQSFLRPVDTAHGPNASERYRYVYRPSLYGRS
jgi:hypothetical protein